MRSVGSHSFKWGLCQVYMLMSEKAAHGIVTLHVCLLLCTSFSCRFPGMQQNANAGACAEEDLLSVNVQRR